MTQPTNLFSEPGALRVRKRLIPVAVAFARQEGVCETLEGAVRYAAGDAILTGGHGEHWPIRRDLFDAAYRPVQPTRAGADGLYVKQDGDAVAVRLDRMVQVPVGWKADDLQGRPGDWLLSYADGSFGIVADDIFRESYEPEAAEADWPPTRA